MITFLCSPNNPTGRAEPPEVVAHVLERAPGLVVVDEAYGQFAPWCALDLVRRGAPGRRPAGGGADLLQDVVDGGLPPRLPGGRPRRGRRL